MNNMCWLRLDEKNMCKNLTRLSIYNIFLLSTIFYDARIVVAL